MKKTLSFILAVVLAFTLGSFVAVAHTAYSFSDAVAYKQSGEVWSSYMYGGRSIGSTACGILATVNAINYMNGVFNTEEKAHEAVKIFADYAYSIGALNGKVGGGTARYYLFGTEISNVPPLVKQFGKTYGFTMPIEWTEKWNYENVYNGKEYNNIYIKNQNKLKEYLAGDAVAIAHVPGHFICLADYDPVSDRFLVLDSAPADKRENLFTDGVSWFSSEDLSGGVGAMTVGGYCVLQTTRQVTPLLKYPYTYNDSLMLYDGGSFYGIASEAHTNLALDAENASFGRSSLMVYCDQPTGGTVSQTLSEQVDLSDYRYLTLELYLPKTMDDNTTFQVSFGQDLYDEFCVSAKLSSLSEGWYTVIVHLPELFSENEGKTISKLQYRLMCDENESAFFGIDHVLATNARPVWSGTIYIGDEHYGDADDDGKVSANDALQVLQMVVGKLTPTLRHKTYADVNGDGSIGADDALLILQHVVGKIPLFPIEING